MMRPTRWYPGLLLTFLLPLTGLAAGAPSKADPASGADRPLLSRGDLPRLKTLDRSQVFATLGSFDDQGLSETEFVLKAGALLDAGRVPGLAEALAAGDASKVLEVVYQACKQGRTASKGTEAPAAVLAVAEDALVHRFTFYGETYQLPDAINWDENPGTAHWGHDLNRFSYLHPLTEAYQASGDGRYSRKVVALILDWITKCDFSKCFQGTPYVFGSYLNNAIHCETWCRCMEVLLASDQVQPAELMRVLKSLHDQLAYLEVVTNGHSGNWPTIGCRGMLSCVTVFPMLRDAGRFADYSAGSLGSQLRDQVKPDGVQDELTPHYHRVVVSNLLAAHGALRRLDRSLDAETLETLRKMVHYVQQTAVPDGSKQAALNDSDPGSPGHIARAVREAGLGNLLSPVESLGPEWFPYAGVAFLRQRQDQGDLYLAFDAGPYGRGHQHEDKLGFWLFAYGRNFLVDPGRHLYDHSARSYYDYLKSTTAHSTIKIDGQGQHSAGRRDTWIAKEPLDLGWQVAGGEVRARGSYDLGYGPKNDLAVVHRREIVLVRERCWVVFDLVEGEGEHLIESRFQFAPGKLILNGDVVRTDFEDANLSLCTVATTGFDERHIEEGQENPRGGWYSDSYGEIEPAPALSQSVRTPLPWRAATLLFPWRGTDPPQIELALDERTAVIRVAELGEVRVECSLGRAERPSTAAPATPGKGYCGGSLRPTTAILAVKSDSHDGTTVIRAEKAPAG